jgi:hypothetical protein
LLLHGLGDHPIVATLTGFFVPHYYDEFRKQRRKVFQVIASKDIHQSETVQRR